MRYTWESLTLITLIGNIDRDILAAIWLAASLWTLLSGSASSPPSDSPEIFMPELIEDSTSTVSEILILPESTSTTLNYTEITKDIETQL